MISAPPLAAQASGRRHTPFQQSRQTLQVVRGHLQAQLHLGSRQANAANELAAQLGQSREGVLDEHPLLGNASVAPLLRRAQGFVALALALDLYPITLLLERQLAGALGVATVGIDVPAS